jgi:hypothetical protein
VLHSLLQEVELQNRLIRMGMKRRKGHSHDDSTNRESIFPSGRQRKKMDHAGPKPVKGIQSICQGIW